MSSDIAAHSPSFDSSNSAGPVGATFKGGLKFGLGFALAMIPLMAIFFVGVYFMSTPTSENASLPIERVADRVVIRMEAALNAMIERLREIVEATVRAVFDSANAVTAATIEKTSTELRQISDQTIDKLDERTSALIRSTSALMEEQFTRFGTATIETWNRNTEALISRFIELLNEQSEAISATLSTALQSLIGLLLGR